MLRSHLHVTLALVFPLTWLVQGLFLSADDMQEPQGDEKEAPQVLFSEESVAPSFIGPLEVGRRMGSYQESDSPFGTGACVGASLCLSGPISPSVGVAPHSAQPHHQHCPFSCWDSPFSLLSSSFIFPPPPLLSSSLCLAMIP